MKIEQRLWTPLNGWEIINQSESMELADLVIVFGTKTKIKEVSLFDHIRKTYPTAFIIGCSTAGEIMDTSVMDDSVVVTAIKLMHSTIKGAKVDIKDFKNSFDAGKLLVNQIPSQGLRHLFILSDGLKVNGTELIKGIMNGLPAPIPVTGGLSGDGGRFQETVVMGNGPAEKETIVLIGFYGEKLRVGFGSQGGWDPFGPERLITHSKGNVLLGMDGKSALELYKKYLGKHAEGLPATGLLFPLSVRTDEAEAPVVRTILSVNEIDQSMTFAGDVPQGAYATLMKANVDRLIDGAVGAAEISHQAVSGQPAQLAILISCVGRKMVLKQRVEEEVEGVIDILGKDTRMTGFYSYGEISPFKPGEKCELHNQTMTITTFSEEE